MQSKCEHCIFAAGTRLLINMERIPAYVRTECKKERGEFHSPEGCELFRDVNQTGQEMEIN